MSSLSQREDANNTFSPLVKRSALAEAMDRAQDQFYREHIQEKIRGVLLLGAIIQEHPANQAEIRKNLILEQGDLDFCEGNKDPQVQRCAELIRSMIDDKTR